MRFVILIVVIAIAAIAGFAVLHIMGNATPVPQQPTVQATQPRESVNTVDVLVAKAPIPIGTILDDAMVDKQPWPENLALEGFIIAGGKNSFIKGKVTRGSFQAREPLTLSKMADPNDAGFLAAELPEGMRAITIASDAITGVAGYVFPGDRVDVVLTHNIPNEIATQEAAANGNAATGLSTRPSVAEVLIGNARVLAVNTRPVVNQDPNANTTPSSYSIEVTDLEAQRIRLAEKLGTISLTLRSIKDKGSTGLPPPSEITQISRLRVVATKPEPKKDEKKPEDVTIVRGTQVTKPASATTPEPPAKPVFSTELVDPNAPISAPANAGTTTAAPAVNAPSENAAPPALPSGVTRVLQ